MNSQECSRLLLLSCLISPVFASAETLQDAWEVALRVDNTLKAAAENSAASDQQLEAAKSLRLPVLSLQSGYSRLENEPASIASLGGSSVTFPIAKKESYSYRAMASLPLYTSGRISKSIEAADAALQASRILESSKKINLKLKVSETYVMVLRVSKSLEVARSHVVSLEAHRNDVKNLYQQGMVSQNDLLAAEVALADAKQQAIQVENNLNIAHSAYNRFMARPLNQPVYLERITIEPFNELLDVLTERAIKNRDELKLLQQQIKAHHHQIAAIRAETGPQLALSGGYAYQQNPYQVHEGQWQANVGMEWKLFEGVTHHKASAMAHQAAVLRAKREDLSTRIKLQVRQYWLDGQETEKRIAVTNKSIKQAAENLRVNQDRYGNGLSTNTEVLDAENLRTLSEYNHSNAIFDAVLAGLRQKWAIGEL